jgi:muconolactone delta-isomerase
MEYLVTMTTHVPDGTSQQDVDDVRAREAVHTRELAAQGHVLRLWRPPLQPGEWRTLGFFSADDDVQLEEVLASMPLRVWRTDEVTPLAPHPNDPGPARQARVEAAEFMTTFIAAVPEGTPGDVVKQAEAREADRARELAREGRLVRLWRLPAEGHTLGLWRTRDATEMQAIVDSLPLNPFMTTQITPLTEHPSDPGSTAARTS